MEARGSPAGRKGKGSLSKIPLFDQQRLDNRLERFDKGIRSPRSAPQRLESSNNDLAFQSKPMVDENGDVDWDAITIKGTSTNLEKDYLRLTQVCTEFVPPFGVRRQYNAMQYNTIQCFRGYLR